MKKFKDLFEKSDPCWKGYEMVGMKDKNGRKVPNCVPTKEEVEIDEAMSNDDKSSVALRALVAKKNLKNSEGKVKSVDFLVKMKNRVKAGKDLQKEEVEQLEEGRPSQRHPLEGHEYHRKTDAELVHIAKDAHKAAEAMKSHNTDAENKYRDQANDSATVRYYRQKHGMADWYKKKYGHIKEEAEQINELSDKTLTSYAQKVHDDSMKHDKDPSKRSAEKRNKSVMGFSRAINKLEARPQNEEVEQVDEAMSASYRMALALKREKEKRENKDKAREARGDRFTTGPAQKPTPVQSHVTTESVNEQTASKLGQEREEVPFDKPYKTTKGTVTDKSGAKHSPMSRARDLARKAARKQAGLKEDAQIQDEVPQDKISTPAKQSLTKTAGIVKDLAKGKGKGKEGPDKFNPDPELSSEIQR